MKSFRIFSVLGIKISVDYTWFIVFFLFAWSLALGYFPFHIPGLSQQTYLAMGLISSLLLFVCVLIHELSHSFTSNQLGLEVKEITLFIFGGMAHLSKEPDDPVVELKIAVAGPVASGLLALAFWGLKTAMIGFASSPASIAIASFLVMINITLLVFNLIPGMPLDGGRVLRALWWLKTGNVVQATSIASEVGRGFAMILIMLGFIQMAFGNFVGGIWFVVIGVFLRQAAGTGYRQMMMEKNLEGLTVSDVMTHEPEVVSVALNTTITELVDKYYFTHHFSGFPVVDYGGNAAGYIGFGEVSAIDKNLWGETTVGDAMEELSKSNSVKPDLPLKEALTKMSGDGRGRYAVVEKGRFVGIISRRDILKIIQFKSVLGK